MASPARTLPVLAFLISLAACSRPSVPAISKTEAIEVSVAQPLQADVNRADEYLATLDAAETVQLRARVTGYLQEIRFTPGREVRKNEVLLVIDKRPYEVELKKSQADAKSAAAQLAFAQKEVARLEKGLRNQSVSREDFEKMVANVGVTEAQVEVANSAIERARLNLDFCEVKSPIDGQISREAVTVGNLIQADQTVLTTIIRKDPIFAYFDIDEKSVQRYLASTAGKRKDLAKGELYPITMGLDDDVGFPHPGGINFAETRVNPQTGALQLRGIFEAKNLKRELVPGFSARVRVAGPEAIRAVVVPDRIIGTDQDRKFVFVVNSENKVEYRPVKLGFLTAVNNREVRVITEGLTAADRVIVNGIGSVRQGAPVVPREVDLLTEIPRDNQ